jgi:hypothetical protein
MSCEQFIVDSLAVRTAAHLLHLSSKSYAQHVALGDFYEALTGLTDKYAEVYMGVNDQITKWPAPLKPEGGAVELIATYLELILEEQDEDSTSQALTNILAEMEELTAQTLYKLRYLK